MIFIVFSRFNHENRRVANSHYHFRNQRIKIHKIYVVVWKFGCGPDRAQTRSYRVLIWKSSQGQTHRETPIHLVVRGNARSVTGLARLVTGLAPIIY